MRSDRSPIDAGEESGNDPRPLPSWIGRARLAVLLVCLAAAVVGLLSSRADVLSSANTSGSTGAGGSGSVPSWCGSVVPPRLPTIPSPELRELRASVLAVVAPFATPRYAYGPVEPEDVWRDNPASGLRSARLPGERWPASYEMLTWTPDRSDIGADVFMFVSPAEAQRFFDQATDARCRDRGVLRAAPRPPQARNLTWTNPLGYSQEDVYLLRGSRVYRVADVSPRQQAGLARVDAFACRLPDAGCPRPANRER
jgi:hypothetical protein